MAGLRTSASTDRATWISVALCAAASVAFMTLVFVPQMRAINTSLEELDEKLAFVLQAQKSARATEQSERLLAEVQAYIDTHDDQLIAEGELPSLVRQISQISKTHDALTTRFEPRGSVPYHTLRKTSLALGLRGPYEAIHRVLHDLENLPTRIWVDEVKILGRREAEGFVECDAHLVVFIDNPEKTD